MRARQRERERLVFRSIHFALVYRCLSKKSLTRATHHPTNSCSWHIAIDYIFISFHSCVEQNSSFLKKNLRASVSSRMRYLAAKRVHAAIYATRDVSEIGSFYSPAKDRMTMDRRDGRRNWSYHAHSTCFLDRNSQSFNIPRGLYVSARDVSSRYVN